MTTKRRRKGPPVSSTGNPDWCTPERELAIVRLFNGAPIDLDPCGNPHDTVGARRSWWGPRSDDWEHRLDGLAESWQVRRWLGPVSRRWNPETVGTAFMNPPYTRGVVGLWAKKAHDEGHLGGVDVVGLLPARTSAAWFRRWCFPPAADVVCFLDHRVRFVGAKSAPAWETVLVHWGMHAARFARIASQFGTVWRA